MELTDDESLNVEAYDVDESGRITIGKEYANDRVRAAILERIDENSAVPDGYPRYDYEDVGLTGASDQVSRREALVRHSNPGDPYWFGTTGAGETEVGISADKYRQSVLIMGRNRTETRTAIQSQYQQIVARGEGALVVDHGKRVTTSQNRGESPYRAIAREYGREGDVNVIDVSSDGGTRYNYLEFDASSMHSLGDEDFKSVENRLTMLLSGNDGAYWGPRMSRILQTVLRQAPSHSVNPTLRDLYELLAGEVSDREVDPQTDRASFTRAWMDETREALGEADANWGPLLQRLQPWVETPEIRKAITPSQPELSVRGAIDSDEIIVITGDKQSRIVQASVAAATVLRVISAMKAIQRHDQHERSAPYTILAERFDRVANTHRQVVDSLRSMRQYGVQLVGSAPGLSAFDDDQDVASGFATRLTFSLSEQNAKREARHHGRNVSQRDLQQLPADVAYLQPQPGDHAGESIRCKGLKPVVDGL